jgi:hypothetical protein
MDVVSLLTSVLGVILPVRGKEDSVTSRQYLWKCGDEVEHNQGVALGKPNLSITSWK